MTKVLRIYLGVVIWGIVSVAAALISVAANRMAVPTVWRVIADGITVGILFLAGRAAKQQGAKPVGVGLLTGLLYGLVSGWVGFFVHVTRSVVMQRMKGHHLTSAEVNTALHFANSTAIHIVTWVGAIVVSGILGLIFGAIGGATAKGPSASQDV